jgi:hypothetical protein
MKNLKTVVFTVAIMTMASISSYAQSAGEVKKEKFMLIFRGGDTHPQNANSKEAKAYIQSWMTWMQGLGQNGILVGGESLQRTGKQVSGKNKVVTDGAFIVSKEMVNGYLIINAIDISEAVEISKGCPIFQENGKVEVRPVQKLEN